MNKFVKVILIIAGVLFGIGMIAMIAAFAMGITWNALDDISIKGPNNLDYSIKLEQSSDDVLPDIDLDISNKKENGNSEAEKLSFDNIKNLKIESGASVIHIYHAPVESVEIHYNSAIGMSTEVDDGHDLEIECGFVTDGAVEILIPDGISLNQIDLDIGAGQVNIEQVAFNNLDADVGAGELNVTVPDTKESYDYDVNCGLGEIVIGEEKFSGISSTQKHQGSDKSFDIDCGAGKVEIQFAG